MAEAKEALRVGYVPEHFSTPLHFAQTNFGLGATLIPFPSGTGHMISALRSSEIDVGIGLTEGWIAGLGAKKDAVTGKAVREGGYSLVGTYVETPLRWAISTGLERDDLKDVKGLQGGKMGVSRVGSGSYIMGFVLADRQGWLGTPDPPFTPVPLQTFASLRASVNDCTADFFLWEHFTSARYYVTASNPAPAPHPIRPLGHIDTPWPSWHIVARSSKDPRLGALFEKLDMGVRHFEENPEEAIKYIHGELDYTEEDARAWMKTVKFAGATRGVRSSVVEDTIGVLVKAGVLVAQEDGGRGMIAVEREVQG